MKKIVGFGDFDRRKIYVKKRERERADRQPLFHANNFIIYSGLSFDRQTCFLYFRPITNYLLHRRRGGKKKKKKNTQPPLSLAKISLDLPDRVAKLHFGRKIKLKKKKGGRGINYHASCTLFHFVSLLRKAACSSFRQLWFLNIFFFFCFREGGWIVGYRIVFILYVML